VAPVDHSIIQLARGIVALITRLNQVAAQTFSKRLEAIVAGQCSSHSDSIRTCYPTPKHGRVDQPQSLISRSSIVLSSVGADLAALALCPRRLERGKTQQASDMVGA
jgi:hypothetical protein